MSIDLSRSDEQTDETGPRYFWIRFAADATTPGGALSALRRGLGHEPGAAPSLWRYYTQLSGDGHVSAKLRAEHAALVLFGIHQEGQRRPMHQRGVRLGEALRALRLSGRYSEQALDRRVSQCATADDLAEMTHHLRGLISMLKTLQVPQGLDYSRLVTDLTSWQYPDGRARVRRQWGADYFRPAGQTPITSPRKDSADS